MTLNLCAAALNQLHTFKAYYQMKNLRKELPIYTYIANTDHNNASVAFFAAMHKYSPTTRAVGEDFIARIINAITVMEIKNNLIDFVKQTLEQDSLSAQQQLAIKNYMTVFRCLEIDINCRSNTSHSYGMKYKKELFKIVGQIKLGEWLLAIYKDYQNLHSAVVNEVNIQINNMHQYSDRALHCFSNATKASITEYHANGLTMWETVIGVNTAKYLPSFNSKITECYEIIKADQENQIMGTIHQCEPL